ncbi:MAG: type II secretion system F family protein, partial [Sulfurovum sp.]|nr:type II secretion system F family protein [Sulfurovum sp.]
MKYFNVTVMDKGKKRQETVKADSKMDAVNMAKKKFPRSMVMRAVETAAPLEDTFANLLAGLQKSAKSKIPIQDKISTIRQIAVMTDAGISITDTLAEVSDNTSNPALKVIYA